MREILFRGKRKDNGEWVFGFYEQYIGDHYIFFQSDRTDKGADITANNFELCAVVGNIHDNPELLRGNE